MQYLLDIFPSITIYKICRGKLHAIDQGVSWVKRSEPNLYACIASNKSYHQSNH